MTDSLQEQYDHLLREYIGVQEMLALVLYEVGEPVVVPKQHFINNVLEGFGIAVDDHADSFVFSLEASSVPDSA